MDATTTNAIFAAAATNTYWTSTNLGLTTQVNHDSYTYFVRLPKGEGKAFIAGRDGYGGDEHLDIDATWAQTAPIVEAAMAATRVH
ncbi:hypothetical protein OG235_36790 [Streptomyces sp. NBC_00024]|uniref:hypothetical protein n=1 Tax=Streptomyces sp. NBC_00024 TaxID=2903612 RepID=UPI003247D2FF